jgi:hypothetical protein
VRILIMVVGACAWLGLSGHFPSPAALADGRVGDLLVGIADDVGAILGSFSNGPDDPKGPVRDQRTLQRDSTTLDDATHKAEQLATELRRIQNRSDDHGR